MNDLSHLIAVADRAQFGRGGADAERAFREEFTPEVVMGMLGALSWSITALAHVDELIGSAAAVGDDVSVARQALDRYLPRAVDVCGIYAEPARQCPNTNYHPPHRWWSNTPDPITPTAVEGLIDCPGLVPPSRYSRKEPIQ